MALTPFWIIPPVIILWLTFVRRGRIVVAKAPEIDLTWPATVALVNVLGSIGLLTKLNGTLIRAIFDLWQSLYGPTHSGPWI